MSKVAKSSVSDLWLIKFSENGEEYYGYLKIRADNVRLLDKNTIDADGVQISTDEYFIGSPVKLDSLSNTNEHFDMAKI